MRWRISGLVLVGFITLGLALSSTPPVSASTTHRDDVDPSAGIMNLDHLIFIVQENRSFDHYFGTFPGADGLPRANGHVSVCIPDPAAGRCRRPYHDTDVYDEGGPHNVAASKMTVSGGTMHGSIRAFETIGTTCQHHPQGRVRPRGSRTRGAARRDGVPHGAGDPELLGVRAHVRLAGPHVRPVGLVDAALAPLPGVGVVGDVPPADGSDELSLGSAVPRQQRGRQRPDLEPGRRRRPGPTRGRTSPGSCRTPGSAGATTWGAAPASSRRAHLARSPTATRSRTPCPASEP